MEIRDLAREAVALLGGHLDSDIAVRLQDSAGHALHELIRRGLAGRPAGETALAQLEERPSDEGRQEAAASQLQESATEQGELVSALEGAVRDVRISQGAAGGWVNRQYNAVASGSASVQQNTVTVGEGHSGDVAGGNIDKSRRNKFSITGAAIAALLLGGGGYAWYAIASDDSSRNTHGVNAAAAASATAAPNAGDPKPSSSSARDAGATGRFGAGMLVAASCTDDGFALIGVDPDTGQKSAERVFVLPSGVKAAAECGSAGAGVRQMFDATYERMAVTIEASDGGTHVGYLTASGKLHDLTGDQSDEFSTKLVHENDAVFDRINDQIWFQSDDGVRARDASSGKLLSYRGAVGYQLFQGKGNVAEVDTPVDGNFVVNPSGTAIASSLLDTYVAHLQGGKVTYSEVQLNARHEPVCYPIAWIDDRTVLCAKTDMAESAILRNDNVYFLKFSGDYSSVDSVSKDILPESDRDIVPIAVSPDKREMLFQAKRNGEAQYYRVSLKVGAKPSRLPEMTALADESGLIGGAVQDASCDRLAMSGGGTSRRRGLPTSLLNSFVDPPPSCRSPSTCQARLPTDSYGGPCRQTIV